MCESEKVRIGGRAVREGGGGGDESCCKTMLSMSLSTLESVVEKREREEKESRSREREACVIVDAGGIRMAGKTESTAQHKHSSLAQHLKPPLLLLLDLLAC